MQLMAFIGVYLFAGVGLCLFAVLHARSRSPLFLLSLVALWPLCAPFLLEAAPIEPEPIVGLPPEKAVSALTQACDQLESRLVEIDVALAQNTSDMAPQLRQEHLSMLQNLRKSHAEELQRAHGMLQQLRSQMQLSRLLEPCDGQMRLRLEDIQERITHTESMLASNTEVEALCQKS